MRSSLKVLTVIVLVLAASLVFISEDSFAITPTQPFLDMTGDFQYSDGKQGSGPAGTQYRLDLNDANITQVQYVDLSFDCDAGVFGCTPDTITPDPVLGWVFTFDYLNNNNGWDDRNPPAGSSSLEFGPDPIQVSITDGNDIYMTADLSFFNVVLDYPSSGGETQRVNWNYDDVNLTNFTFNTGYDSSQYLTELYTQVVTYGGPVALHLDFSFNTGCDPNTGEDCSFSRDATGSFDGKAVAPEPVSSILFVVGGVTLAVRRFRREKKIRPDLS